MTGENLKQPEGRLKMPWALVARFVQPPVGAPRPAGWSPSFVLFAVLAMVLASCGAQVDGAGPLAQARALGNVAPGVAREALTDVEVAQVRSVVLAYVDELVLHDARLAGLEVRSISPVFDEEGAHPIGAMARLLLPSVVPDVTIVLVRSRRGVSELIKSEVTNLRALDAIVLLANDVIVSVAIAPLASDAADPGTVTKAHPVDPETHRDAKFGDTD